MIFPLETLFFLEFWSAGGETFEWVHSYDSNNILLLQAELRQAIENDLSIVYDNYSEWFNLAEYPDVEEQLDVSEIPLFRRAAGVDPDAEECVYGIGDEYDGLRAVIMHRLGSSDFARLESAARLFNWTIECGLDLCDASGSPGCLVRIGRLPEFASFLLDRVRGRVASAHGSSGGEPDAFERRFGPLLPAIEALQKELDTAKGLWNDLSIALFTCIYRLYAAAIEEYYAT